MKNFCGVITNESGFPSFHVRSKKECVTRWKLLTDVRISIFHSSNYGNAEKYHVKLLVFRLDQYRKTIRFQIRCDLSLERRFGKPGH